MKNKWTPEKQKQRILEFCEAFDTKTENGKRKKAHEILEKMLDELISDCEKK